MIADATRLARDLSNEPAGALTPVQLAEVAVEIATRCGLEVTVLDEAAIAEAGLEQTVIGLVGPSSVVAAHFDQPLDVLFIDGGHGAEVAWADYESWTPKVLEGGLLMIHDVFEDPRDGGRPPYEIYLAALSSGRFEQTSREGSLRVLLRLKKR